MIVDRTHDIMDALYQALKALSILLFLYYGLSVLVFNAMVKEFERFGLIRFRKLTGSLEVLGAAGLILGYFVPQVVVAAAGGLTVLMVLGVAVRCRAGDSLADTLAAFVMSLVNLYIFFYAIALAS